MNHVQPRGWMERMLLAVLAERDRETIAGDLDEEYGDRFVQGGRLGADLWYGRQIVTLAQWRLTASPLLATALALLSGFTAVCGLWLGAMDAILRHPGFLGREWIAVTIVGEALLTLAALRFRRNRVLRGLAMAGCAGIVWLAARALYGVMHGLDFEGYIVLIAAALAVQAALALVTLSGRAVAP